MLGTFTGPQAVGSLVYSVSAYIYGSTSWCSACHNRFDPTERGRRFSPEGHASQYLGMWRHPMDVHFIPPAGADTSVAKGTPYEHWDRGNFHILSTYKVACLTCHRAHSTTVSVTGYAYNWPRDAGGTSNTSALLRMDSRGTCYNCHGAAQYNCWNDRRTWSGATYDCGWCHPNWAGKWDHLNRSPISCSQCHKTTY